MYVRVTAVSYTHLERLSLAEKRNRQERKNKKSRKEREQEKRRKKQERDRRKQKNIPTTAQQSIPYIRMLQDGICQVTKTFFSKTIQFYDINYQLALNEDKTTIFENYCDFLNYFDSSISVQPVSYTHLDVYKRQGVDDAVSMGLPEAD